MYLTIDFYEPEWHNHRIVCQCYVKNGDEYNACRDAMPARMDIGTGGHCVSTECVSTGQACTKYTDDAYIEKHIALAELELYIADVYHYTGQYYDSNLEEYFDKEDWDSVLYDLERILNKGKCGAASMISETDFVETHCLPEWTSVQAGNVSLQQDATLPKPEPLPDMPVIVRELIMVKDVA
jgi:hypothetical protein